MSLGFYFDQTRCIGCHTCQVACKDRFDLQEAGPRPRRVDSWEVGTYPNAVLYHNSISCNHCAEPACVANCPTGAMYKNSDGIVLHDDVMCIQCRTCVESCPYDAPQYLEEENLIIKCDTCLPLREAGLPTVCMQACPYRALEFGDLDELRAAHEGQGELVNAIDCIADADETTPALLILPRAAAVAGETPRAVRM